MYVCTYVLAYICVSVLVSLCSDRVTRLCLYIFVVYMIAATSFDELYPLWAYTPPNSGEPLLTCPSMDEYLSLEKFDIMFNLICL